MKRRVYLRTAILWILLVLAFFFLTRFAGEFYRTPILGTGEIIAQITAPSDVRITIREEGRKITFAAGRGEKGVKTGINVSLFDASASLFLATVLLTPVGSPGRRALSTALAFLGFVIVMGFVIAGLALLPLVQGGFISSRVAWRLAALSHNAASSGLIITFPAAIWFISTLSWWRRGFAESAAPKPKRAPAERKLTRQERRKQEREERKKKL